MLDVSFYSAAGEADLKQRCEISDGSIELWPRSIVTTSGAVQLVFHGDKRHFWNVGLPWFSFFFSKVIVSHGMHQVCGSATCKSCNSWTSFGVRGPSSNRLDPWLPWIQLALTQAGGH